MAYGLKVTTSNAVLQLDSERSERYGHIKSSGTATSWTITNGDLFFVKLPQPSSGTAKLYYLHNTSGNTYVVRQFGSGTTAQNISYVLFGTQLSTSLPNNPDTYGLQVKNADNEVTLDSRKFISNANFETTAYIQPNTLIGYGASNYDSGGNPSDALITTNFSKYIHFNWSLLGSTTATYRGIESSNNYLVNGSYYTGLYYRDSKRLGGGTNAPEWNFYFPNNSELIIGGTFNS